MTKEELERENRYLFKILALCVRSAGKTRIPLRSIAYEPKGEVVYMFDNETQDLVFWFNEDGENA